MSEQILEESDSFMISSYSSSILFLSRAAKAERRISKIASACKVDSLNLVIKFFFASSVGRRADCVDYLIDIIEAIASLQEYGHGLCFLSSKRLRLSITFFCAQYSRKNILQGHYSWFKIRVKASILT